MVTNRMQRLLVIAVIALTLSACATTERPSARDGETVPWSQLSGWRDDRHAEAWPALLAGCRRLAKRPEWKTICEDTALFPDPDDDTARAFFETRFEARALSNGNGESQGLITGYYEPLLHGSHARSARYRYPVYRPPSDLLIVDLGEVYPELSGKRLRGRLIGRRVVPISRVRRSTPAMATSARRTSARRWRVMNCCGWTIRSACSFCRSRDRDACACPMAASSWSATPIRTVIPINPSAGG